MPKATKENTNPPASTPKPATAPEVAQEVKDAPSAPADTGILPTVIVTESVEIQADIEKPLPPVLLDGERNQIFRQEIAAFVPGSVKFGSAPAALVRLKENLSNVIAARRHVEAARSTLEQLKAERVTGTEISGAESILGVDLPYFEKLIKEAEYGFNSLAGVA